VEPNGAPKRIIPLALFTVDVDLQHVVDLTTDAALRALNVSVAQLTAEWRVVTLAGKRPITHDIGAAAREAEFEALLYPSARVDGATNLAIIVDRLRRGSTLSINPAEGFVPGTTIEVNGTR
jgi:RES domain-containing protein